MKVKCPHCKKEVEYNKNPYRPFCSERCKLIDLGDWAMEKNAIPSDHATDETGPNLAPEEDDKA